MSNGLSVQWTDFFWGESAFQNYFSEFLGILLAIFVIDKLIQYRINKKEQPLRDMACVIIYELVDSFIADILPEQYIRNGARSLRFGDHFASSGVYSFDVDSEPNVDSESLDEVMNGIKVRERSRWKRVNWSNGLSEDERQLEEANLKAVIHTIRQYGRDIEDFLQRYQTLLGEHVVRKLSLIRFEIATGLKNYYEPLKRNYSSSFGVDMLRLLPILVTESIHFNEYLAWCYGHRGRGWSRRKKFGLFCSCRKCDECHGSGKCIVAESDGNAKKQEWCTSCGGHGKIFCADHWTRPKSGRPCFLTTAIVGQLGYSDDCHDLCVLRHFRDTYMMSDEARAVFVRDYYQRSPRLAKYIQARCAANSDFARKLYESYIAPCVQLIENGLNQRALEEYRNLVEHLTQEESSARHPLPISERAQCESLTLRCLNQIKPSNLRLPPDQKLK